jgi:glycosyltransferase involved in cell wall biosynthesis
MIEIGRRLAARGHEVRVLSVRSRNSPEIEEYDGIRFERARGILGVHAAALAAYRSNSDVYINDLAHVLPWGADWVSGAACIAFFHHLHRRTLPLQLSGPAVPLLTGVERLYPRIYPRATWITESTTSRSDLESLGIPAGRIRTIPPGVDLEAFAPRPKRPTATLVYFAGFRPYKRPELLVPLLRVLASRGIELRAEVVGDGPSLPHLRRVVEADPLLARLVTLHGRVPDPELSRIVGECWVNVHLAVAEGWGFSVLEAAAAGTPTVGFAVPGIVESVEDGRTGRLVSEPSIPSLADATEFVLKNHRDFGAASRGYAEQFSWDRTTALWEGVLHSTSAARR